MSNKTDLTTVDVDSLLADFTLFASLHAIMPPQRPQTPSESSAADGICSVEKRLSLLLRKAMTSLLQWSELAGGDKAAEVWRIYHAAARRPDSHLLTFVIRDLERIKAVMNQQAKIAAAQSDRLRPAACGSIDLAEIRQAV